MKKKKKKEKKKSKINEQQIKRTKKIKDQTNLFARIEKT